MKRPNITEGEWKADEVKEGIYYITVDDGRGYVGSLLDRSNAQATSAVPELIDEGIKALEKLHSFYYDHFSKKGYNHVAAEDRAQKSTELLYEALIKAGCKKEETA